jgi:hypothetical protein
MTLKEWLDTPCKESEIAYLDENRTIAYIPIGIIESIWDEINFLEPKPFFVWSMNNFKFNTFKSVNTTFASGSVEIEVSMIHSTGTSPVMKRIGGATIPIFTKDENQDYEGTILSLAVSNASKKFGRRFGRHLNGRMEVGETAIQIDREPNEAVTNRADERWKKMMDDCKTLEELGRYKDDVPLHLKNYYAKRTKELF